MTANRQLCVSVSGVLDHQQISYAEVGNSVMENFALHSLRSQ